MAKKEKKPEFVTTLDNTMARDYSVYIMKPVERILYFLAAFAAGAAVGYIFFGGIGKNDLGEATSLTHILNTIICVVSGTAAGIMFIPIRTNQIIHKRKMKLRSQFRELLDALATSLGSGKNVIDSFLTAYDDLNIVYPSDELIMQELQVIKHGLINGFPIERLLVNFAERSGIEDINTFADVFATSRDGNLKDIIGSVQAILNDKMSAEEQIETVMSSSKLELTIMMIMPILMVLMLKSSGGDFANNLSSGTGIISTLVAVILYIAAYFVGKKMMEIKV